MVGDRYRNPGFAITVKDGITTVIFNGPKPAGVKEHDDLITICDGQRRFLIRNATVTEFMGQMTITSKEVPIYEDVITP